MLEDAELVGEGNLDEVLTPFQPKPKKRGRPFPIDDGILFSRREEILGFLEYHWAEVGWELQHARTLSAIRNAFKPIPDPRDRAFKVFLHDDTQRTTARELHEQRRVLNGLRLASREAYAQEQQAKERLEQAEDAVKDVGEDARILRCYEERKRHFLKARQDYRELVARIDELEVSLRGQSAYIAQSELLDFVSSKRYKPCPLSFADAMAGLPEVSWRVSAKRCRKQEASHPFQFQYDLFLEVARALANHPRNEMIAVEEVKEHLLSSKIRDKSSAKWLKKDWYFLRVSIEAAYACKPQKGTEPYQIFAEYMRRTSSVSRVDGVLAELERL